MASAVVLMGSVLMSCDSKTSGSTSSSSDSTAVSSANYSGGIAYIQMDSLLNGYGMYIDLSDVLSTKGKQIEAELTSKGRSLEREVREYQEKAEKGLVTRYQAQTIEEGLQKKQQQVVEYRDKSMGEMQQEQVVMLNSISDEVMKYLKEYNASKGYSMILQTSGSNPILLADPAMDITQEILVELNKRYLDSKATKK